MRQIMSMGLGYVSIGLSLALCVACGSDAASPGGSAGSNSAGSSNTAGSGGSGSPAGGGPGNSAGASNPGSSGAAGTSSTPPGNFSSGASADKQLGSLTDQEFAGLCQKLHDYFSTGSFGQGVEDFSCRVSGLLLAEFSNPKTDAELQTACKTAYDSCIAGPTMTTESCTKPDASCTATVGEYETCVNDTIKALGEAEKAVPACDKLTLAFLAMSGDGALTESPASCTTLDAKCPSAPMPPGSGN